MKKLLFTVLILFVFSINLSFSESTGRATRTSTINSGCGSCHGAQPNANTSVSFLAGPTTVEPNSTNNYSIRVYSSGNVSSGINIGVKSSITGEDNSGILSPGTGLKSLLSELVHSTPKMAQNGNADFDFTWKAPSNPGKYFMRAVGAACNDDDKVSGDTWNFMPVQEIIVRGVELTAPVGGENFCAGGTMSIKWNAAAIEKINIDLSFDGGISYNYRIAENLTIQGGNYLWNIPTGIQQGSNCKIKLTDASDPNKSSVSKNTFGIYGLFTITKHPESKEICEGQTYRMSINAVGTGLKFQWRKNGSPIANANDTVYTIVNARTGDAGAYGCIVSSPCQGNVSSTEADVKVRELVKIKLQPVDAITCPGGTISFMTDADGQNIQYQWFKDNAEVLGARSYKLEITNAQDENAGRYWCKVSGFCPPTRTTDTVTLTVNKAATITKHPISQIACEKNQVEFSVETTGEQINYQWFFNNSQLSVPNQSKLVLKNVNKANIGKYYCIVGNPCGPTVKSNEVDLNVNLLPKIKSQTQNSTRLVGEKFEFKINAEEEISSIQWYFDSKAISGADSLSYIIESLEKANSGTYYCILKNDCGEVKSLDIKLTVVDELPGPRIAFFQTEFDFDNIFVHGMIDSVFTKIIKNSGDANLVINDITFTENANKEFILLTPVPLTIKPNEEADLRIIFSPNSPGLKETAVEFNSNAINQESIIIRGLSCDFIIDNEKVINFGDGDIEFGPKSYKSKIYNYGNYNATLSSIEFTCPVENPFSLKNPLPLVINALDSFELEFEFAPKTIDSYLCVAELQFTNPDSSTSLSLVGQGVTSVEDNYEGVISYPNPINDKLIIEGMDNGTNYISIFNQIGVQVIETVTEANKFEIDFNNSFGEELEPGVYFVKVNNNFKSKVFKIVKIN